MLFPYRLEINTRALKPFMKEFRLHHESAVASQCTCTEHSRRSIAAIPRNCNGGAAKPNSAGPITDIQCRLTAWHFVLVLSFAYGPSGCVFGHSLCRPLLAFLHCALHHCYISERCGEKLATYYSAGECCGHVCRVTCAGFNPRAPDERINEFVLSIV